MSKPAVLEPAAPPLAPAFADAFADTLASIKAEGRYRTFLPMSRAIGDTIPTSANGQPVTVWCSNDYLGMGKHPEVLAAMEIALKNYGAGAGGTRNIAGNCDLHEQLEHELATWHGKQQALLFTSGYVANEATLSTLAKILPGLVIFSDAGNHASMITGIRQAQTLHGASKVIFPHNDLAALEHQLQQFSLETPKLIAVESVYSMEGDITDLPAIVRLAKQYGAMTFVDEVHAVGLYGATGAGQTELQGVAGDIDIIQGTLAKAVGVVGGYIAGNSTLVDCIRSMANGFIFTTAIPPVIAAGCLASVQRLKIGGGVRARHQHQVAKTKHVLDAAGIERLPTPSHIVPVLVRGAARCKQVSDALLHDHGIYLQPINYPTVPKEEERLRITPSPHHDDGMIERLVGALGAVL